jgi:hypothetical protein
MKTMHVYSLVLATLFCASLVGCVGAGPESEAGGPASGDGSGSTQGENGEDVGEAASASSCPQFKVIWPAAGVYELPSTGSTLLKTKHAGDIVGGYCNWTYYNSADGNEYLGVSTESAQDGVGWLRRSAVVAL